MSTKTRLLVAAALITIAYQSAESAEIFTLASIKVRPVMSYAQFGDSHVIGDTSGSNKIRTKTEDIVGGFAAYYERDWRDWTFNIEYAWRVRTDANAYVYYDSETLGIRNNLQSHSLTANVKRLFNTRRGWTPYIAGGAGIVRNRSQAEFLLVGTDEPSVYRNAMESHPTWNLGAGVQFTSRSGWQFDLGYRYVDLGEATTPSFRNDIAFSTGALSSHDVFLTVSRAGR